MNKIINILVTAVGGDLGQSVIKCLRDSGYDVYIYGCDMNPYAAGRADVDEFFIAPGVRQEEEYLDFLKRLLALQPIDFIFPLSDLEIAFYNGHRQVFSPYPARFVVADPGIIDTFQDKYKTVEYFKNHGFDFPVTYLPGEYQGQLDFPVILKKRRGSGSQALLKVMDQEELGFYLKRKEDMIIQEYIEGDNQEYTSGLFSDGENKYTITFRRKLAPGGFSQQVEIVPGEQVLGFPGQLAEKLNFTGSINVQFRKQGNRCIPFEINPRFSSTVYFRHLFGFKDVQWNLDMRLGKKISYQAVKKRAIGVRKFGEVIFNLE